MIFCRTNEKKAFSWPSFLVQTNIVAIATKNELFLRLFWQPLSKIFLSFSSKGVCQTLRNIFWLDDDCCASQVMSGFKVDIQSFKMGWKANISIWLAFSCCWFHKSSSWKKKLFNLIKFLFLEFDSSPQIGKRINKACNEWAFSFIIISA